MSRKALYKNSKTGNYGVLENQSLNVTPGQVSNYLTLTLFEVVGGAVELGSRRERVLAKDLVEVAQDEVENALLNF